MSAETAQQGALIAVDWGTTNRRGYLIGRTGEVLENCEDGLGLAHIEGGAFEAAFDALTGPWRTRFGELPALLSGMVGASTGWHEAPYCGLPAGIEGLSDAVTRVPGGQAVWIVPGVSTRDDTGMPDVIRGEEVQAIAAAGSDETALIVLPGTHSKWVRVEKGRIVGFQTFMTGDLHAAILKGTILGALFEAAEPGDPAAFEQGVSAGFAHSRDLTHILFGARSRVLFGELEGGDVSDYLSGMLIGAELASARGRLGEAAVKLVGSPALCSLYELAFARCEIDAARVDTDNIGNVYCDIARRAGLLENG